jgi:hypothetical protein
MPSECDSAVLAGYARDGWAAAPGFFSPDELAEIDRFAEETKALPDVPGAQMVYWEPSLLDSNARVIQRIEDFCPRHSGFDALIRGGRLQRAVEQLLGGPGDVLFFDSYVPQASKPNLSGTQRRVLYLTYNRASDGDHRKRYYADKRLRFPPDIDRLPGVAYRFRV